MKYLLSLIMNSKKMKYSLFQPLIKNFIPNGTESITFYIDVMSVLSSLYQKNIIESFNSIKIEDKFVIGTELLNLAAHYRHFFYSRYRMYSNFIFYYNDEPDSDLKIINPEYKKEYFEKRFSKDNEIYYNINKNIRKNLELIEILSDYLPEIYIVNTKDMESNYIPYYFIKDDNPKDKNVNFVLTNNKLEYSIVNMPNTFIMTIKSDKSRILSKDNIMNELLTSSKTRKSTELVSDFYNFILALSGYPKYGLEGKKGLGSVKIIKTFENAIIDNKLSNTKYTDINELLKLFSLNDNEIETVKNNYRIIDPCNYINNLSEKKKFLIDDQIKDKKDWKSVKYINERFFKDNPIMTEELLEGIVY